MKTEGAVLTNNENLDLAQSWQHQGLIPHLVPPRASSAFPTLSKSLPFLKKLVSYLWYNDKANCRAWMLECVWSSMRTWPAHYTHYHLPCLPRHVMDGQPHGLERVLCTDLCTDREESCNREEGRAWGCLNWVLMGPDWETGSAGCQLL